jgi:hypothetical protein
MAASSLAAAPLIVPGTYRGAVRCTGSDRFSDGARARRYRSSPTVTVAFGSSQRLERWTYLFLGRHDLVIQSHAVKRGQSFTYAAGAHIGRPGRTRVTIDEVRGVAGGVDLLAHLDWSSPRTRYIGSGTYALALERVSATVLRYDAVKVVVKQPQSTPSKSRPIVRRNEHCTGILRR